MTRRKNNKTAPKGQQQKNKTKQATPFRDAGEIAGAGLGGLFGMPALKNVGRFLGSGIGSIFGSGDYQVTGPRPGYNVLSGQTPQFSSTHATNIVCHREFLGDINGTSSFLNRAYYLNPGDATTFPWLSGIARSYQQYRFHGLVFEFRPLITDFVAGGSPGALIMATNYNAEKPLYATKHELENSEFATSCKPTQALLHMVECDVEQTQMKLLNVRSGPLEGDHDYQFYDLGLTQLATTASPSTAILGELWVTYCVEFFKPQLSTSLGDVDGAFISRSGITSALPFGTTFEKALIGNQSITVTSDTVTVPAVIGKYYEFSVSMTGAFSAAIVVGSTGLSSLPLFQNGVANGFQILNGASGTVATVAYVGKATSNVVTFFITNPGVITATSRGDFIVSTW